MTTIKPLSCPDKRLSESITSASSSFKISSILGWDGVALTSADFGTKAYAAFRNDTGTELELMEIDPATVTAASSAITILKRGLKFDGTLATEVSANKKTWIKGSTIISLGTHFPQLIKSFVDIYEAQTIEGVKTFSSLPATTAGNPLSANDLARKAYVDSVVAGIATSVSLLVPGTAGETLVDGNLVYLKTSDNRWWKTDADTAATVENVLLGIAQGAGTAGVAVTSGIMLRGVDDAQSGLVAGEVQYASNTAGAIANVVGTVEVTVGVAKSATELYFDPRFNQQLTENQQDLLVAFEGGTDFYAASTVGTDSYAITISPAITAYATGMKFRFKADVANTGACTLAVSGLSALAIKKLNDQDLATGDIEIGQIVEVVYDGVDFQMQSQTAVAPAGVNIQVFTSSGTWTKPSGALSVEVYAVGGGGGGGSGRKETAATSDSGGSGGGGGSLGFKRFNASGLSATETVTVNAGGAGGAGVSGADANGNAGAVGGNTTFGTTALLVAKGGSAGLGGLGGSNPAGGAGGIIGNGDMQIVGGAGGAGRADDAAGDTGVDTASDISPRGGGAGGGHNASSVAKNGGIGGGFITNYVKAGGAVGTIGNSSIALFYGGTGGGGSNGGTTSATGGAGIEGSGGGGSGASSTASGAGGVGGAGFVIVISYF